MTGVRALDARGGEIRTFNDAPNLAMVRRNGVLGFVRFPSQARYALRLKEGRTSFWTTFR